MRIIFLLILAVVIVASYIDKLPERADPTTLPSDSPTTGNTGPSSGSSEQVPSADGKPEIMPIINNP
jgi:hypothetical protein